MDLCRVVGTIVATNKDKGLVGRKLQVVEIVDLEGRGKGSFSIAVDSVGAGQGEYVLVASSSSARETELTRDRPCDLVIMAIVELLEVEGKIVYQK